MKIAVLKRYEGTKELDRVEKFWNILSICLALTMATYISINENLKFLILENKTEEKFIASDQPVFNVLSDKLDEKGNVIELELFYPITPKLALSIRFDEKQKERLVLAPLSLETIRYFNSKIIEHADYYIFANSENQLKQYLRV